MWNGFSKIDFDDKAIHCLQDPQAVVWGEWCDGHHFNPQKVVWIFFKRSHKTRKWKLAYVWIWFTSKDNTKSFGKINLGHSIDIERSPNVENVPRSEWACGVPCDGAEVLSHEKSIRYSQYFLKHNYAKHKLSAKNTFPFRGTAPRWLRCNFEPNNAPPMTSNLKNGSPRTTIHLVDVFRHMVSPFRT